MRERHDYAFPFRIDPVSRQARRAGYEAHVEQMVIQLLLTSPGERADLPELGCGIRGLLFAPSSSALAATAQVMVHQSLVRWLSDHLTVRRVDVLTPEDNQIIVHVEYTLNATRTDRRVDVLVQA